MGEEKQTINVVVDRIAYAKLQNIENLKAKGEKRTMANVINDLIKEEVKRVEGLGV